jgi:hypothetical protein
MALQKLPGFKGYGQIELNQVAFRRDGRIEAQCKLDATDFAETYAENGGIYAIDQANRTVKLPTGSDDFYALNYSSEHMYDERAKGLKDFKLGLDDVLPRLGYLAKGDKFTINTVVYDDGVTAFNSVSALEETLGGVGTTAIYAQPCTATAGTTGAGYWQLVTAKPASGPALKVVKYTTMPDGQKGIKFQVVGE